MRWHRDHGSGDVQRVESGLNSWCNKEKWYVQPRSRVGSVAGKMTERKPWGNVGFWLKGSSGMNALGRAGDQTLPRAGDRG